MSLGQLTNDDLVANQVRFDSQAHNEPAVNTTAATVALSHEIEIDESHRVLNSPAPGGGHAFYVANSRHGGGDMWLNMDDHKHVSMAIWVGIPDDPATARTRTRARARNH